MDNVVAPAAARGPTDAAAQPVPAVARSRGWIAVGVGVALFAVVVTPVGRPLEFDEAVFYSQSGGVDGSGAPPNALAASREIGTWALIGVLRLSTLDLAGVRLVWTVLSVLLLIVACWQVGRWCGRWSGQIGALLFATFWTSALFIGSFYGSLLGAATALLATGLYLQMREEARTRLATGVVLGLAVAGAFYMRHVETLLVVLVLAGHSLVRHPGRFWRERWPAVAAAMATFVVAFAVPWAAWSTRYYGSVWERLRSARGQGHPLSLHNGVGAWTDLLLGDSVAYSPAAPLPRWSSIVIAAGGAVLLAGVAWALIAMARRGHRAAAVSSAPYQGLLIALTATSFGFFFFVSGIVRARYSLYGVAFASMVGGQLAGRLIEAVRNRTSSRRWAQHSTTVLLALAMITWVAAQVAVARPYQQSRAAVARENDAVAQMIRLLARDEDCRILTEFGRPHFQAASGCVTRDDVDSAEALPKVAESLTTLGQPIFVIWPSGRGNISFDADWRVIGPLMPDGGLVVYYHLPEGWPQARSTGHDTPSSALAVSGSWRKSSIVPR